MYLTRNIHILNKTFSKNIYLLLSGLRDVAKEQETVWRQEHENRQLTVLVEKYERKIVVLNEEMEQRLQDRTSHIEHITIRYEEENQRQLLKMRDMHDELLWYKEQLPGFRMPTWLNG